MDEHDRLHKYLDLSYRYLSIRNRSVKEMKDYLQKKNAESEQIETIISKLFAQKFLDDEKFARSWILARARMKPKGRYVLEMELRQKGIEKELIEKVLNEIRDELPSEIEQAKEIIKGRMQRLQSEEKQIIYQKVGAFLARRGYTWDTAKKAIDSYLINR